MNAPTWVSVDELAGIALEAAIDAAAQAATAFGNDERAIQAWAACHVLKALRAPVVARAMDQARLERARTSA